MQKISDLILKYPRLFVILGLITAVFLIWGLFYFFYSILNIILPAPISFFFIIMIIIAEYKIIQCNYSHLTLPQIQIILYGIYCLLYSVCRFAAFPGSYFFIKRNVENNYCKTFAKRGLMKIQKLNEIILCMIDSTEDVDMIYTQSTCAEISTIKQNIQGLSQTFNYMSETYNIDKDQRNIQVVLNKITNYFSQIKFEDRENDNHIHTLSSLFEDPMLLSKLIKSKSMISDKQYLTDLSCSLEKMEAIYLDLLEQKPLKQRLYRWMYNKSLGSLDQLRSDIEQQFEVKRLFLKSFDNKIIDCLVIYGDSSRLMDQNGEIRVIQDKMSELPTLIYCNPNAGYYESLFYDSDWIEYYNSKGINLVLWNYRGYGCSEGTPTPQNLFKDCECIVDYLRSDLRAGSIGIHGQSLGGMVASFVAQQKKLNFLLADRTFTQFSDIAQYAFGSKVKSLFRMLVDWDFQISTYFVKAECYKVIGFDLKDEIIPYMANLKNGVAKDFAVLNNKLHITQMIDFPKIPSSSRSSLSYKEQLTLVVYDKKLQMRKAFERDMRLNQISQDILSLRDISLLFNSFRRIMEVIKDVSQYRSSGGKRNPSLHSNCNTVKNKKTSKAIRRSNSDPQNLQDEHDEQQLKHSNSQNLNESINLDMTLNTSIIKQPYEDADSSMIYQHNHPLDHQLSPTERSSTIQEKTSILTKSNSHETIPESSTKESNTKSEFQKSHLQHLNDDIKSDSTFQDFLINSFSAMDQFDSAGLPLSAIFTNFKIELQLDLFKQFILNLEQWGSLRPQTYTVTKNLNIIGLKKYGLVKLKETIKKFHEMIQQHKTDGHYYFEKLLNQDFTTICNKLSIIKERLSRGLAEEMRSKDDIETCLSSRNENESEQMDQSGSQSQYKFSSKDKNYQNSIGFLLPLDCGHNGLYSRTELNILDFHLKRSGFIQ